MIIFINGSINSGKSTVSKLLVEKLGRCALIEIDSLREMINSLSLEESIPINLKNAVSLIRNFSAEGISSVVPYPLSQKNYEYVRLELASLGEKIYFFTLAPALEEVLKDRGDRQLDEWERERIQHHYKIGIHQPDFGEIIDTTNLTPEETCKKILGVLLDCKEVSV